MATELIEARKPTRKEKKEHGGDVVFVRRDRFGKDHFIFGSVCHESWQQWGESTEILGDNVDDIEEWRRGKE